MKRLTYRYPMTTAVCTKHTEWDVLTRLCELEDAIENGTLRFSNEQKEEGNE